MSADRWDHIQQIFAKAIQFEGDAQQAYLVQACGEDNELLAELTSLLEADKETNPILDGNAIEAAGFKQDNEIVEITDGFKLDGREIGPYTIVKKIGAGGMGSVYLASRSEGGFEQKVALKLIRPGITSDQVLKRFEREEEILARLNHPNIARLLDSGVTDENWPYLVMDFVEGKPLDEYANKQRLNLTNRLLLFQTILATIQYAHQNFVVHRDLKPDNIFVNNYGSVTLLDFGISKLVQGEDRTATRLTRTGMKVMTLEYGAPEQVMGKKITEATDIYALGVVLYEFLCGLRPFHMEGPSIFAIQKAICSLPPVPPAILLKEILSDKSHRYHNELDTIVENRSCKIEELITFLEGPVQRVCLRALEKDPAKRYSTAAEMLADIKSLSSMQ